MEKVPITLLGFRCQRCGHEWVPRTGEQPKVCPSCKSPYWNISRTASSKYGDFKASIQKTLQEAGRALSWSEVRQRAALPQKFPNNRWVRRMEIDIGLMRLTQKDGKILWSLKERGKK